MSESQRNLFNWRALTPHRTLARIVRERVLRGLKSMGNSGLKEPASVAAAPGSLSMPSPESSPASTGNSTSFSRTGQTSQTRSRSFSIPDPELHMPDEARTWVISCGRCPECGSKWDHAMIVKIKPSGSYSERRTYSVRCGTNSKPGTICQFETPWFDSSVKAIQYWQVTAAMKGLR